MANKIAFLSNITTKPFDRYLKSYRCKHFNIGTIAQTLSKKITIDYLLILLDDKYYFHDEFMQDRYAEKALTKFAQLKIWLANFRARNSCKILFFNVDRAFININTKRNIADYQKLMKLNLAIERLSEIADVVIINLFHLAHYFGRHNFYNLNNNFLFQTPFTKLAFEIIAKEIDKKIHLFNLVRKKVIVLDGDNTLWGGIIGEDGLEGIMVDENYPGIVYRHFQMQMKYLKESGILLALVSKNNQYEVQEIFDTKNMPLTWDDFVVKKINWRPKSENIRLLAKELNISLESIIFFDDSDFECTEVSKILGIDTVKINTDNVLENLALIESITSLHSLYITKEDTQKFKQYKTEQKRKEIEHTFSSIEDYLPSVQMKLTYCLNDRRHIIRITQLINKTNQFNLTTQRYSEKEVSLMLEKNKVFAFWLSDKFGDMGLISVVIIKEDKSANEIDTFLISCRVLGRGVEQKILYLVSRDINLNSKKPLKAKYIKTKKNVQVENFYEQMGFELITDSDTIKIYKCTKQIPNINYITEATTQK